MIGCPRVEVDLDPSIETAYVAIGRFELDLDPSIEIAFDVIGRVELDLDPSIETACDAIGCIELELDPSIETACDGLGRRRIELELDLDPTVTQGAEHCTSPESVEDHLLLPRGGQAPPPATVLGVSAIDHPS